MPSDIAESLRPLAVQIDSLTLLPGNPRRGDIDAVARSYERFGQRKPIVARRDGTVIAGNHQLQAAQQLGWDEIAVVYVDDDEMTAKAFALADNRTADLSTYDMPSLSEMIKEVSNDSDLLVATGFTVTDLDNLLAEIGSSSATPDTGTIYTTDINIPQYEIVGECPQITELYDDRKARELQAAIKSTDMPDEVKQFLLLASYRHVVFTYSKIAELYPHMPAEIQQLMEDSVLVIIDVDDAIKNGFVKLSDRLEALMETDRDVKSQ